MGNFIEVTESRYNGTLLLNIDQIVATFPGNRVLMAGMHGEGTGFLDFSEEEIKKIRDAIYLSMEVNKPCSAHRIVGCTKH